jgi:hypothetical protein
VVLLLNAVFVSNCVPCGPGPTTPDPADSVILESKIVAPTAGACASAGLRIKIYITNQDSLGNITLPLTTLSTAGGTYGILSRSAGCARTTVPHVFDFLYPAGPGPTNRLQSRSPNYAQYHSNSPDSFLLAFTLSNPADDNEKMPSNAARALLGEIKFDSVTIPCGQFILDSTRILDNTLQFVRLDGQQLPVNFVRSHVTVPPGSPAFDLRTEIVHFGTAKKGKWRWVRIRCQNLGGGCSIPATVTWNAPGAAEKILGYAKAHPVAGGASVSAPVTPISPTSLMWHLPALNPGDAYYLWAKYKIPCGLANGTPLTHTSVSEPVFGDVNTPNNTDQVTVQAAPTTACPEPEGPAGASGAGDEAEKFPYVTGPGLVRAIDTLTFPITFRNNTGGTNATVTVKDTIDTDLDLATLDSIGTSHPYTFSISGREVTWTFSGVGLPDSLTNETNCMGFAAFGIQPVADFGPGDTIFNEGQIYFDSDPPLPTTGQLIIPPCPAKVGNMNVSIDTILNAQDVVLSGICAYLTGAGSPGCDPCYADVDCDGNLTATDVVLLGLRAYLGVTNPPWCGD